MRLSTRLIVGTIVLSLVFGVLLVGTTFMYALEVDEASAYLEDSSPAFIAIEHLLETTYQDFLLVEEYLLVNRYSRLQEYDSVLASSQEACEIITEEVDDLILINEISNDRAIANYQTAVLVYESMQRVRNSLVELHKEQLATGTNNQREIAEAQARYVTLMQNATAYFTESLQALNEEHRVLQANIQDKSHQTTILLFGLLVVFILIASVSSYFLYRGIGQPLNDMVQASRSFTSGNYDARVQENSPIAELRNLSTQLNRVYTAIDNSKSEQKKEISSQLLLEKYAEILDFVKLQAEKGISVTLKDIKKHFNLTHPTVNERVRYLESNGYVTLKKQGRHKVVLAF